MNLLGVRKCTFGHVRSPKTQISLRIRTVWLESSLSAWWNIGSLAFQSVRSEYTAQTEQMCSLIWIVTECTYQKVPFCFINPCPAEWIKMPCPNLIFSQSDYLIRIVVINSYTNGKQCRSRSVGFRSQLIWIYTVCKGSVYPGSAGQGLILDFCFKVLLINLRLCKVSNQFRNSFW